MNRSRTSKLPGLCARGLRHRLDRLVLGLLATGLGIHHLGLVATHLVWSCVSRCEIRHGTRCTEHRTRTCTLAVVAAATCPSRERWRRRTLAPACAWSIAGGTAGTAAEGSRLPELVKPVTGQDVLYFLGDGMEEIHIV